MSIFNVAESLGKQKDAKTPKIDSFSVQRDHSFRGYKCILNWEFNKRNILGFRVWRSRSQKVLLNKEYNVSQLALERLSSIKSFNLPNNVLFDKQVFSQNSKLQFDNSKSSRYTKLDEKQQQQNRYEYEEVGFVKRNRDGLYSFEDKKVKFGESYYYILSAINTQGFESQKSNSIIVRIEDLDFPDAPTNIVLTEGAGNIQIEIGTKLKAKDVERFEIYRRDATGEQNFKNVGNIYLDGLNTVTFIDYSVLPGKRYEYKIYSVDLFGNLSLSAIQKDIPYLGHFERRLDIPNPKYKIEVDEIGRVIFKGEKNHDKIIGYRLERKDAWKFEEKFESKTFLGKTWPAFIDFNDEGIAEFVDNKVQTGKIYQYRISSIKENGRPATFALTPHFHISSSYRFPPADSADDQETPPVEFARLKANAVSSRQNPIYTKLQWEIRGEWEYLILEIRDAKDENAKIKTVKIDNLPNRDSVFIKHLERNKQYILSAKIYSVFDDLVGESNSSLNRVRISL